ncbi:Carboxymuconolactone decarboxylase family [Geosmithia morbida]|uniref:Carboxymuconolactone decarboxylase family n=1 Tax=Geosmithia morbida TaxID=1094350 RepID=A0A9P4YY93_9HYPO|nr:Carboxymuconolactone decarboxylase family [Geosmithia morbida]KAF4124255.1 Carboxymuconolactone decarboxylase family [Geosmithia morbida]
MRIPYVADPPPTSTAEEQAVVERVRARRAPRPLQPLDRALLHSPAVADGWNTFLGAIRTRTSLAADVRELAISRVAVCNGAWYEWGHHAPLAAAAGVSDRALDVVRREGELPPRTDVGGDLLFDDRQWAVLAYTDEMTRRVRVGDDTFAALRALFSDREISEITATVGRAFSCRTLSSHISSNM